MEITRIEITHTTPQNFLKFMQWDGPKCKFEMVAVPSSERQGKRGPMSPSLLVWVETVWKHRLKEHERYG